jgi:hypothetical protein
MICLMIARSNQASMAGEANSRDWALEIAEIPVGLILIQALALSPERHYGLSCLEDNSGNM